MSNPLHLYRALLRQSTYLPDPQARAWTWDYIASRFRRYQKESSLPRLRAPAVELENEEQARANIDFRRKSLLRKARTGLFTLHKANAGYVRPLTKVLEYTYGRVGPRRYELMAALTEPEIPTDDAALETMRGSLDSDKDIVWTPQVRALAESQQKHRVFRNPRTQMGSLKLDIAAENSWGRPMPRRRVRKATRLLRKKVFNRLLPPLPAPEWDRLQHLSRGTMPWQGPIRQRPISSMPATGGEPFIQPYSIKRKIYDKDKPHIINARFMRRRWDFLLQQCPLLVYDDTTKGYKVYWSRDRPRSLSSELKQGASNKELSPKPTLLSTKNNIYFAGVDSKGRLMPA